MVVTYNVRKPDNCCSKTRVRKLLPFILDPFSVFTVKSLEKKNWTLVKKEYHDRKTLNWNHRLKEV